MKKIFTLTLLSSVVSLSLYSSDNDYEARKSLIKKGKNVIRTEYGDIKVNFSKSAGNRSVTAVYEKGDDQRKLEIKVYDIQKNVLMGVFKCQRIVSGKAHDNILVMKDNNFFNGFYSFVSTLISLGDAFLNSSDTLFSSSFEQTTNTANRQDTLYFGNREPQEKLNN